MKRFAYLLLVTACVLGLTAPVFAQLTPTVLCQGNTCGAAGPRNYYYDVSVLEAQLFTSFGIGTHDANPANYSNWVTPAGWIVTIKTEPGWTMPDDPFTPHGQNTGGPTGLCPYTVFWNGSNGIVSGQFGFDNPNKPHDVGWVCSGVSENWAQPVGTGTGPVHGPVPEPGSLLALGSGLFALAGTFVRRRR